MTRSFRSSPAGETNAELPPSRRIGCFGLLCGAILVYLSVATPLQDAARHVHMVRLPVEGAVLAPVFTFAGFAYTLAPTWAYRVLGRPGTSNATRWYFYGPLLVVGWLLYQTVKQKIAGYGYAI